MLKNILISKVRIKVLEQFFFNPTERYHVRGLVRILDEEINAIRRELLNLESTGLLKSQRETNKIVFTLNKNHSLIDGLKELIFKNSEFGTKLNKIAKECGKPNTVIISEAYLNKVHNDQNDIDFLFIGEFDLTKLTSAMKELEAGLEREIKFAALSIKDFSFAKKKQTPVIMNILNGDFVITTGSVKELVM